MAARFEIVQDTGGKFLFQLRASDGSILLHSLASDSKLTAQNEVVQARTSLQDDARVVDHGGSNGHFVVVKSRSGAVIARSSTVPKAEELPGLRDRIRASSAGAPLVDLTKRPPQSKAS
ncbi:MAG: hypothetical protein FJ265_05550 [Planctomycetes bacterium]|nr:hypothetical protein [Planctomycetota bacterium]